MIIIGEKINSTLKAVRPAIENYDAAFIQDLARRQYEAGANYIDVNAGMFHEDEPERLEWLVKTVQEVIDAPFSIDSPNAKAIEKALKVNKNGKPIINSITDEKERYESILPLILEYNTSVIALCMDDSGMPETVEDRLKIAERIIGKLSDKGIKHEDIYIDPMVRPIGTGSHYGVVAIETIRSVKAKYPGVHIACGLSNISFGLPGRKVINQAFLIAAMTAGMDGAILDPLDKKLMTYLYATEALLGNDEFCMNYLSKFREGLLEI
ncbi:MAG: methyltetrahydrofolate cobalamin methyltransferase [Clostridiaceae bacterium]|nr:methyltetrahydrofolate cobalamin methyltransferase [Clostridiaceae bacterium]